VLVAILAVAVVVGISGDPELAVTDLELVKGTRNVATISGTVDPPDAVVRVRGRPARVRDGEWEANARPGPGGELRVTATDGDERMSEVVTVPGPRLEGTWNVLQADVYASSVAGGELRRGRSAWRFRAVCGEDGCTASVLEFPSPGGVTRIRLRQRGKRFTGMRRYMLPRSGVCLGKARATRWTTSIELTVTDWRARGDELVGTRFRGTARHRSRFDPSLPCEGGRLLTRLRGSVS
jgi:hypothetical protein